jgi:hypothetical protein
MCLKNGILISVYKNEDIYVFNETANITYVYVCQYM